MQKLIAKLLARYPDLKFVPAQQFVWSPETGEILYSTSAAERPEAAWSLLHETGHALLGHKSYKADFELIRLEAEAWQKAQELGRDFAIEIDQDHIQDCLDTYRDWLYKRSICPVCTTKCLQQDDFVHYKCFNCHAVWRVSASRFCRAYRSKAKLVQTPQL